MINKKRHSISYFSLKLKNLNKYLININKHLRILIKFFAIKLITKK